MRACFRCFPIPAVLAVLSCGPLAGCTKSVMKPERAEAERLMDAVNAAGRTTSAKESEAARSSDDARKATLKKTLIVPLSGAGFDPDKSLQALADKFSAKNFATEEEEQIFSVLLNHYAKNAADLERLGLIEASTATALKALRF